jgi:hypothetical protein
MLSIMSGFPFTSIISFICSFFILSNLDLEHGKTYYYRHSFILSNLDLEHGKTYTCQKNARNKIQL